MPALLDRTTNVASGRFSGHGPADLRPLRGGAGNARATADAENFGQAGALARAFDRTWPVSYTWSFPVPTELEMVYADGTYSYRETSSWTDVNVDALIGGVWTSRLHWTRGALLVTGLGSKATDGDNGLFRDLSILASGFCELLDEPTTARDWRLRVNATMFGALFDLSVLDMELPDGKVAGDYAFQYNPSPRFDLAVVIGAGSSDPTPPDPGGPVFLVDHN